jgi:hypothetical protein
MTDRERHDRGTLALCAVLLIGLVLIVRAIAPLTAHSRELYPGQYAQVDPVIREWFGKQHAPNSSTPCCSTSDGTRADEERRDGRIWTRFTYIRYLHGGGGDVDGIPVEERSDWMEVPEDTIIRGGTNPTGNPVVWYYTEGLNEVVKIRCYKPAIEG